MPENTHWKKLTKPELSTDSFYEIWTEEPAGVHKYELILWQMSFLEMLKTNFKVVN
jgi:hypothetical protein